MLSFSDSTVLKIYSHLSLFFTYRFRYLTPATYIWKCELWRLEGVVGRDHRSHDNWSCISTKKHASSCASVMWRKQILCCYSTGMLAYEHTGSTVYTTEHLGISEHHFLSLIAHGLGRRTVLDLYLSSRKELRVAITGKIRPSVHWTN